MTANLRPTHWLASPALLALALGLAGCPGKIDHPEQFLGGGGDGGATCTIGVNNVPTQILQPRCANSGCHEPASLAGGLDLASPNVGFRLLNRPSSNCDNHTLVVPNHPEQSYFLDKLHPRPACGQQMPFSGTPLSPSELECMRLWVGALTGGTLDGGTDDGGGPDVVIMTIDVPMMGTDVQRMDVQGTDVQMPDVQGTDVQMPDVQMPDVQMPDVPVMGTDASDAELPDTAMPMDTAPPADTGAGGSDAAAD